MTNKLALARRTPCIIIRLNWTDNKFLSVSRADLTSLRLKYASRARTSRKEDDRLFVEGFPGNRLH